MIEEEPDLTVPVEDLEPTQTDEEVVSTDLNLADEWDDEEEFEPVRLSWKQWLVVAATALGSALFFTFLWFPYGDVIRTNLSRLGIHVSHVDLSPGGTDRFDQISAQFGRMNYRIDTVESTLGWFGFSVTGAARGEVVAYGLDITVADTARILAPQLLIEVDLDPYLEPARYTGTLSIRTIDANIPELKLGNVYTGSSWEIAAMDLKIGFDEGRYEIAQGTMQTNRFDIRINGSGRLRGAQEIMQSELSGQICLRPVEDLANVDMAAYIGYVNLGGTMGGELCMNIKGTLANPQVEPPNRPRPPGPGDPPPSDGNGQGVVQ